VHKHITQKISRNPLVQYICNWNFWKGSRFTFQNTYGALWPDRKYFYV